MCVLASILAFGSCWAPGCFSASLPTVKALPVMGGVGTQTLSGDADPWAAVYLAGSRQQVQLHIGIR